MSGSVKTGLSGQNGEGPEKVADNDGVSRSGHLRNCMQNLSLEDVQIDDQFELISQMKKKDRSPDQQRYFEKIKKQRQRKGQSQVQRNANNQKNKDHMREMRMKETPKEAELRQKKNQEHMKETRLQETAKEAEQRKKKDQQQKNR